jgi:hypothetical protein
MTRVELRRAREAEAAKPEAPATLRYGLPVELGDEGGPRTPKMNAVPIGTGVSSADAD